MIDAKGRLLHRAITAVLEDEADQISYRLGIAMDRFDNYMNKLNNTTGMMYDKHGNAIMKYDNENPGTGYNSKG
jgi:hypothetical protein